MTATRIYKIDGFEITMTAGGVWGDGISVTKDDDLTDPNFIRALQFAQTIYSDFYEYGYASETYSVYEPSYRDDVPERFYEARREFVKMLVEHSISEVEKHRQVMSQTITNEHRIELRGGYVYLVQAVTPHNHYKIGYSKDPITRIRRMDVILPFPIETLHTIKCDDMILAESMLHDRYAEKRVNGEWFELSEQDVSDICGIDYLSLEQTS